MFYKKTQEEKDQKQLDMIKLEVKYEEFLRNRIAEKKNILLVKYPQMTTVYEGWLYGVYVAILDNQDLKEKKGKLYYLFENISEASNKYKLSYSIDAENNCTFSTSELQNFPKAYISILKRHNFNLQSETENISALVAAHIYKLDEETHIHQADYNKLNNTIKNLVPLEKSYFNALSEDEQKNLAKAQQFIPEKYKVELKRKAKDVVKMEYRACDLYYHHRIPVEKIAATLRNRLKKADILRIIKLYSYFPRVFVAPPKKIFSKKPFPPRANKPMPKRSAD